MSWIVHAPPPPNQYLKSTVINVPNCFKVQEFDIQSSLQSYATIQFASFTSSFTINLLFAHLHVLKEKWKIQGLANHRDLCSQLLHRGSSPDK